MTDKDGIDWGSEDDKILALANWAKPEALTNRQLAAFVRREHGKHVVGHEYANGCKVINAVYEEAAKRLEGMK